MVEPTTVATLILVFVAILLIAAAVSDARGFRIPNAVSVGIIALFPLYLLVSPQDLVWSNHLSTALIVLAVGFFLFSQNLAGAGDIKLLAATSLWAGPSLILPFLLTTTLGGGLLSVIMIILVLLRRRKEPLTIREKLKKAPVPYGVAIALGGLCVILMLMHPALPPVTP